MNKQEQEKQQRIDNFMALEGNSAGKYLGISLVEIEEDHVILKMPITDKVRQPFGLLHGGMSMALAESAASMHAAFLLDLSKEVPVGIEINGSHVGMAREGTVKATATISNHSRKFIVHSVEIRLMETDALLSIARVTNYFKAVK